MPVPYSCREEKERKLCWPVAGDMFQCVTCEVMGIQKVCGIVSYVMWHNAKKPGPWLMNCLTVVMVRQEWCQFFYSFPTEAQFGLCRWHNPYPRILASRRLSQSMVVVQYHAKLGDECPCVPNIVIIREAFSTWHVPWSVNLPTIDAHTIHIHMKNRW